MTARLRLSRWWLALAYVTASVLVQSAHQHGERRDAASSGAEASCRCGQPHLSGHPAEGPVHAPDHCLACQFRASHHAWQPAGPAPQDLLIGVVGDPEPLPAHPRPTLRPSCRAPPVA
ncbi:MAG TPA: hypothetical protein VG406_27865 [Isosphaeraceae bacterium]|nr:hypothetical protein [Isosphaeraceae bacterium]